MAPAPASRGSHSMSAPVASTALTAASTTSGPMPSPLIKVTLVDMLLLPEYRFRASLTMEFLPQYLRFLDWPDLLARLAERAQSSRGAAACLALPFTESAA